MSTTLNVSPSTQAALEACKQNLQMNKHRLESTFSFVPDDKLTYSPSPTAKSCLQLVAHAALSNYNFAAIIRREFAAEADRNERMAENAEKERAVSTREEALQMLQESTAVVIAAIDGIDDETIKIDVPTPFVTMPMMFWLYLPSRHMDNHASQIDYIQTIWGDMEWHFG